MSGARKFRALGKDALTPLVNERASGMVALATMVLKTFATHPLPRARTSRMRMVMRRLKRTADFRGATIGQAVAKVVTRRRVVLDRWPAQKELCGKTPGFERVPSLQTSRFASWDALPCIP